MAVGVALTLAGCQLAPGLSASAEEVCAQGQEVLDALAHVAVAWGPDGQRASRGLMERSLADLRTTAELSGVGRYVDTAEELAAAWAAAGGFPDGQEQPDEIQERFTVALEQLAAECDTDGISIIYGHPDADGAP